MKLRLYVEAEPAAPELTLRVWGDADGQRVDQQGSVPCDPELVDDLPRLAAFLRRGGPPLLPDSHVVGQELFGGLFRGALLRAYAAWLGRPREPLSLSLSFPSPDGLPARLPWELLYGPSVGFLALTAGACLTRGPEPSAPAADPPPALPSACVVLPSLEPSLLASELTRAAEEELRQLAAEFERCGGTLLRRRTTADLDGPALAAASVLHLMRPTLDDARLLRGWGATPPVPLLVLDGPLVGSLAHAFLPFARSVLAVDPRAPRAFLRRLYAEALAGEPVAAAVSVARREVAAGADPLAAWWAPRLFGDPTVTLPLVRDAHAQAEAWNPLAVSPPAAVATGSGPLLESFGAPGLATSPEPAENPERRRERLLSRLDDADAILERVRRALEEARSANAAVAKASVTFQRLCRAAERAKRAAYALEADAERLGEQYATEVEGTGRAVLTDLERATEQSRGIGGGPTSSSCNRSPRRGITAMRPSSARRAYRASTASACTGRAPSSRRIATA